MWGPALMGGRKGWPDHCCGLIIPSEVMSPSARGLAAQLPGPLAFLELEQLVCLACSGLSVFWGRPCFSPTL